MRFGRESKIRYVTFRNDSGEEVPPYGVVKIDGAVELANGSVVLKGFKPDGDECQVYINGPSAVPSGKFGSCGIPTNGPMWVRYSGAPGAPVACEVWGAVKDSWELSPDGTGFVFIGLEEDVRALFRLKESGGGGHEIRFEIVKQNCPNDILVKILARDCDVTSVPEESVVTTYTDDGEVEHNIADLVDASDHTVIVYDGQGCNLDEPGADLAGRKGWARYMSVDPEGVVNTYLPANDCRWEIVLICCAVQECQ